jgi:predicted O-linked N-acetylglucosamine transferase (SPINDLY family)
VWLNILEQVEGSVLWTSVSAPQARERLRALAAARGVDPLRLVFAPVVPAEQHLDRLPVADLFLDSFPYSAGATASQCVGAGVPLITLTGETYVSRMATAILHAIGCCDLAVNTLAGYEALAVRLGRSEDARRALRQRVRDGVCTSPMFDPRRMAGAVESACHSLWHAFCNSARHDAASDLTLPEHTDGRQALP